MDLTILGIFTASFFLGENAILPAFVLGHQGLVDLKIVVISSFLASLAADLFWFVISHLFLKKYNLEKWYHKTNIANRRIYQFILHKHTFFSITFIKFLVGLRLILTLALILIKKFSFMKFLTFSALSNVVLIAGLYFLGFLVNQGIDLIPIYHGVSGVIAVVVISVLAANIIPVVLRIYFAKKKSS